LLVLNYGKALVESKRHAGLVPVYGTNGPCGTHDRALAAGPGLVLGRKGMGNLGIEWCDTDFWVIDTAYFATPKSSEVNLAFFYYLIKFVGLNHLKDGTSNPSLSRETFYAQLYPCPPPRAQAGIVEMLVALDDKIDLNRRTNETLESIARTIFKSWFVDCDPMRAKVEGQGRPSMGTVDSVVGIRREGINPGEFSNELFDHYSIPAFDERRMPRQESGESIKSNKFVVPPQTVLLSKLNPRFPRIWLPEVSPIRRSVCSTEFIVAEPKPGFSREFVYCLFGSSGFAESLSELVTGTSSSHQRVRPEDFLRMKVIRPPQELVARFTEAVRPMLKHTAEGAEESLTLSFLRNALLPKLLSGELRIRDAEKMVEAHV
jgi:type I restriction enzyme S subunit